MTRIKAVWFWVAGGTVLALTACGGASRSSGAGSGEAGAVSGGGDAGNGTGGARAPSAGTPGTAGGSSASGGRVGLGGSSTGGESSVAGSAGSAAAAGTSACVDGAPCNCSARVGTTTCSNGEARCTCPPSAECKNEPGTPCFEPCGGDPFGIWRLAESCFPSTKLQKSSNCESFISATPTDNELTLRIADGGELTGYGQETWKVASEVPLSCLGIESVNRCKDATFYTELAFFGLSFSGGGSCVANACGVCDCEGVESSGWSSSTSWTRSGNQLNLGGVALNYCVQGDQMWLGGADQNGSPKVAYKLSKHSCQGKPVPCAQRTAAQCELGGSCIAGHCKGKSSSETACASAWSEMDCGITEGCVWEPGGCYGDVATECSFKNCDTDAGCSWGEPKQRCTGDARPCCQGPVSEVGECSFLDAAGCLKAAGCTLSGGVCSGEAACSSQNDSAICTAMGCEYPSGCKATNCSDLSVASCHTVPGCRVGW